MHQELMCVNCYNPVEKIDFFQELTVELADCVPNALQKYFSQQELHGQTCYTANTVRQSSQGPRWTGLSVPPCSGLGPEEVQG